ncbi:hypothetical protein GCM10014715_85870 [Streptomyces spiralis]|uniref:Uncharacterized protein n=1 Tax=Streptomyces spiralis TaxID=66376 RepID=A0A919E630_9ACTN|nr:hypothetical protein [Streptomyces spiralis]GHF17652.1 hypothetical protein GCM10014715_85870 [Streptomyces spiralis]
MRFEFSRELSPLELIGELIGSGWRMEDGGHISYLVESDMTDWVRRPLGVERLVLNEMEEARQSHGACAVILSWKETGAGGSFLMFSSGRELFLDPRVDTVFRQDADGYVDFEWYLAKAIPVLNRLGLIGYTISDLPA